MASGYGSELWLGVRGGVTRRVEQRAGLLVLGGAGWSGLGCWVASG